MNRITSRQNPLSVHMKKLGADRAYRDEHEEFLCDGIKLLEDAVKSGADVIAVLTSSNVPFALPAETRVYCADRELINSLSPMKNAQDTLFTCKAKKHTAEFEKTGTHILLDGMQDPGNVGAIIRTANALKVKSVILTNGCADHHNPKAIRASMGAVFRQHIYKMSLKELTMLRDSGLKFIGAQVHEHSDDIFDVDFDDSIIAIGNEGSGLSAEVTALCGARFSIPISPECESLNAAAAAAIIMWEACSKGERKALYFP